MKTNKEKPVNTGEQSTTSAVEAVTGNTKESENVARELRAVSLASIAAYSADSHLFHACKELAKTFATGKALKATLKSIEKANHRRLIHEDRIPNDTPLSKVPGSSTFRQYAAILGEALDLGVVISGSRNEMDQARKDARPETDNAPDATAEAPAATAEGVQPTLPEAIALLVSKYGIDAVQDAVVAQAVTLAERNHVANGNRDMIEVA